MIIESIGVSLLLLSAIRIGEMNDKKKIEKIFEYTKTWVISQTGEIKKPKFIRKNKINDSGTEYVFSLPLGLPYKKLEYLNSNIGVFEDGLHKNVELDFKNGMLLVNVYEDDLPAKWNFEETLKGEDAVE